MPKKLPQKYYFLRTVSNNYVLLLPNDQNGRKYNRKQFSFYVFDRIHFFFGVYHFFNILE